MKLTYSEQLKHPNWQKKRLEVLERDNWECVNCGAKESTLHVHHKQYIKGRMAWEYEGAELVTLCESCHEQEHEISDELKKLLALVNTSQVTSLVKGFHCSSDWIDKKMLDLGTDLDPHTYACGFVAYLCQGLNMGEIKKVADFATSMQDANSEYRLLFESNKFILGQG